MIPTNSKKQKNDSKKLELICGSYVTLPPFFRNEKKIPVGKLSFFWPFWNRFGIKLESNWNRFLESIWNRFGII